VEVAATAVAFVAKRLCLTGITVSKRSTPFTQKQDLLILRTAQHNKG
jgi:hypothetical protein